MKPQIPLQRPRGQVGFDCAGETTDHPALNMNVTNSLVLSARSDGSILRQLGLMLAQEEGSAARRPRPFDAQAEFALAARNMSAHYRHWWECRAAGEVAGQRIALEGMRRCRHVKRMCVALLP